MAGAIFILSLYLFVPVLLARFVLRAEWRQIVRAYLIWVGCLLVFRLLGGNTIDEGMSWALIIAMFATIPVIAVLSLTLKLTGWARKALSANAGASGPARPGAPFRAE